MQLVTSKACILENVLGFQDVLPSVLETIEEELAESLA